MANKLNCAIWAVYLTFGHTNPKSGGAAVSQKLYTQNVFFHRLPSRPLRTGTLCEFTTFSAHITIQDRIFHDNKVKTVRHIFFFFILHTRTRIVNGRCHTRSALWDQGFAI